MTCRHRLPILLLLGTTLLAGMLLPQRARAQERPLTTFVLVRHAEKATHPPEDPPLNPRGEQRTAQLTEMLAESGITAIYSTDFVRTRETVRPLAERLGLEIREYDPRDEDFHEELLDDHPGGKVLVVGHTNTIPALANRLLGEERFEEFEESDYGNLLVLSALSPGHAQVLRLRF